MDNDNFEDLVKYSSSLEDIWRNALNIRAPSPTGRLIRNEIFDRSLLKPNIKLEINTEEQKMTRGRVHACVNSLFTGKYVKVAFDNSQTTYTYKTNIVYIEKDDSVVVDTAYGLKIATVAEVGDSNLLKHDDMQCKYIVSKVDKADYYAQVEKEKELCRKINEKMRENTRKQTISALGFTEEELALLTFGGEQ